MAKKKKVIKKKPYYNQWQKFWNNKPFAITLIIVVLFIVGVIIFKPFFG